MNKKFILSVIFIFAFAFVSANFFGGTIFKQVEVNYTDNNDSLPTSVFVEDFSNCEDLSVLVVGENNISEGDYVLRECSEGNPNEWGCDCDNESMFGLWLDGFVSNVYNLTIDYTFAEPNVSECEVMYGMYIEWNAMQGGNYTYDPELDLFPIGDDGPSGDGVIDLSDVITFTSDPAYHSSVLYGRFQEFMRLRAENGTINPLLDVFPEDIGDGVIDLSDIVIFAGNSDNDTWCDLMINGADEDNSTENVTDPIDDPTPNPPSGGGGGGGGSVITCEEGFERINGQCVPVQEEEPVVLEESNGEDNVNEFSEVNVEPQQTGFFGAITGAVVGAGKSIGLGETMSYLLALLLLGLVIVGVTKKYRKPSSGEIPE